MPVVELPLKGSRTQSPWLVEARIRLNNQELFDSIEPRYEKANLRIRVKDEDDCRKCELYGACVGVRSKNSGSLVVVENSGKRYRICKPELYEAELKARKNERRAEGA